MIIYRKLVTRSMQMAHATGCSDDLQCSDGTGLSRPTRRIPIGTRSVTGRHENDGTPYESSLERDFLTICAFDYKVERVLAQPVIVRYKDTAERLRSYTPDFLVFYRRDLEEARRQNHLLCEIKPSDKLADHGAEFTERFQAAERKAKREGWDFRVFTDQDIRTPYLANVRFLLPYREADYDPEAAWILHERLKTFGETDPHTLLSSLFRDRDQQARHLPMLWHLVANFDIRTDLMRPLTMKSRIWLNP